MRYIKNFREAIIVPDILESKPILKNFDDLVKYGEENDFDVLTYVDFYETMGEVDKKNVPPRHTPFFALFHPIRKKPMFVVNRKEDSFLYIMISYEINSIIEHEKIHSEQVKRKGKIEYILPDPNSEKSYFSNKEEIMAFSYTIAKDLFSHNNSLELAIQNLNRNRLWSGIKRNCDDSIIKRYKKYIYLYLEKFFENKED